MFQNVCCKRNMYSYCSQSCLQDVFLHETWFSYLKKAGLGDKHKWRVLSSPSCIQQQHPSEKSTSCQKRMSLLHLAIRDSSTDPNRRKGSVAQHEGGTQVSWWRSWRQLPAKMGVGVHLTGSASVQINGRYCPQLISFKLLTKEIQLL